MDCMKTVKISIKSKDVASRLELFVRIVWTIVSGIVLCVFSLLAFLCLVVHWLYILITGRRHKGLNNLLRVYVLYRTKLYAYSFMLTDERNPIFPED
jgi:Domain of unknown function (DUF4389)